MSDPYIGEIKMFAGNYAPNGFSLCQGQMMSIAQNTALYSIVGIAFGGDGRTTFALPNLGGCSPIGQGQTPGLSSYSYAEKGGIETFELLFDNMPAHTHPVIATSADGVTNTPSPATFLAAASDAAGSPVNFYGSSTDATTPMDTTMAPLSVGFTGAGQPFSVRNPYVTVSFIIALTGEFPQRP